MTSSVLCALPATALGPYGEESRVTTITLEAAPLKREKRIWLYLPPGYHVDSGERFPVVYMQDGQDLFERRLHPSLSALLDERLRRELTQGIRWYANWQLDKRLDHLFDEDPRNRFIVVGIASDGGNRTAEYSPWPWRGAPLPRADQYLEFVVGTLKPYIDDHFPTLSSRNHTAIAGSSLGGLIAIYGGLKYPEVFSKIAALSPVLTRHVLGQSLREYIRERRHSYPMRIYLDLGTEELGFGPLEPIRESLRNSGFPVEDLRFRYVAEGAHRVEHWGERFPEALLWLYR
jgi:enterochelin esterase-like enzyme